MKDLAHLSKFENTLFSGAEWTVKSPLWTLMQLGRGVAYACSGRLNEELAPGSLLVVPPLSTITVLASRLSEAALRGFSIKVSSLSGLLTPAERRCLEADAAQECAPFRQLPASHPLADRLNQLFQSAQVPTLSGRLAVILAFADWASPFLAKAATNGSAAGEPSPKARLLEFMNAMPESELANLSLGDVARHLCCCDRHASRLFHDVCGCSFRQYISDLRLKKACQMLVEGESKIIDVAMDSGHSSLAQFNYTFKNRFRMSPTEWRDRRLSREARPNQVC